MSRLVGTPLGRIDQPAAEHLADVFKVLGVAALDLGEGLRVQVVMVEEQAALLGDEGLCSSQLGRTGMKSPGDASSTLISSSSFRRGIARNSRSCLGTNLRSTSMVDGRKPTRTAVALPVK